MKVCVINVRQSSIDLSGKVGIGEIFAAYVPFTSRRLHSTYLSPCLLLESSVMTNFSPTRPAVGSTVSDLDENAPAYRLRKVIQFCKFVFKKIETNVWEGRKLFLPFLLKCFLSQKQRVLQKSDQWMNCCK